MKSFGLIVVLSAALMAVPGAHAQQAPAGATGQCRDGSYTSQSSKRGACSGHQGVKTWYASQTAAASAAAPAAKLAVSAPTPAPVPASPASPATQGKQSMAWTRPAAEAAPGGGPGLVWVNAGSKVYHCQGDKWYGRTRHGHYMPEADAKAKGYHGPRGKNCPA